MFIGIVMIPLDFLKRVVSRKDINNIIEIGSGLVSTPFIANIVETKGGHFTSLENSKEWYAAVCKQIKYKTNTDLVFSDFGLDPKTNRLQYLVPLQRTYDFVFIDGPSKPSGVVLDYFREVVDSPAVCIKNPKARGVQSMYILDWILPNTNVDTLFLVDGRASAVLHYKNTQDGMKFCDLGQPYSRESLETVLKPGFFNLMSGLTNVTVFYNKKSDKCSSIIRELK